MGAKIKNQLAPALSKLFGYDFTYFSISLLGRFGATQELQSGFKPGDQVPSGNTVPTVSKNKLDWGATICVPLNLMIKWMGKSLGII
jgi:hypothetical protein